MSGIKSIIIMYQMMFRKILKHNHNMTKFDNVAIKIIYAMSLFNIVLWIPAFFGLMNDVEKEGKR